MRVAPFAARDPSINLSGSRLRATRRSSRCIALVAVDLATLNAINRYGFAYWLRFTRTRMDLSEGVPLRRSMSIHAITDDDRSPRIASRLGFYWWARQDSNLEPDGYEPSALTIELRAHAALLIAEVRHANSLDDDFVQSYPRAQQSRYARFL